MIRTYMEDSNKGKQNPGLFSTLSRTHFSLISFLLFFLMKITTSHSADSSYSSPYIPTEDIALSCGSPSTTKFSYLGNLWTSDNASEFGPFPSATTTTFTASTQDSSVPRALYKTARLSTSQFNYTFPVSQGMKFVRLHFYPASYISGHDMANSSFSVTANDRFTLIQDFSSYLTAVSLDPSTFIKEFCVNVEGQKLTLSFTPSPHKSGSFAFINGIEVVSMPNTIYIRGLDVDLPIVGFSSTTNINYTTALETLYRLNVGGSAISAGADTGMFREWLNDDDFVIGYALTPTLPNTQIRYTNATPAYIAPEDVYRSARTMGNSKRSNLNYNLTWSFNVDSGFNYLVRLHFCEFQPEMQKQGDRVFRIFINNQTVEPFADVILLSGGNGIPAYRDYFVMNDDQGGSAGNYDLSVALHPNGDSETMYSDAILNGLELFKLIQHGRNLAGSNPEPLPQNLEPTPQSPLAELSKNPRSTNRRPFLFAIAGSFVGLVIVFSLVCTFIRWCCRRRQRSRTVKCFGGGANSKDGEKNSSESSWWDQISASQSHLCRRHLSLAEMRAATDDFDPNLLIGVGGFGHVYKGYVGSELTPVAIKRGKPTSQQGTQEFRNEIEMLSKLRHHNLVSLMGYCDENGEMILVYEYMAHGTLCDHLYKSKSKSKSNQLPLSWKQRLSICIGAARGIHYLHSHPIIHRDVKTSNILLDENWTAKVSDFGLSRAGPTSVSKTHVSTDVKGTLGYLDPEYFLRQQLTVKSDVYSFGVVLFEVLCGRPVLDKTLLDSDDVNLAQWAGQYCRKRMFDLIIDPLLKGTIAPDSLVRFAQIAEKCVANHGIERPSMVDVVRSLEFALELQETAEKNAAMDECFVGFTLPLTLRHGEGIPLRASFVAGIMREDLPTSHRDEEDSLLSKSSRSGTVGDSGVPNK